MQTIAMDPSSKTSPFPAAMGFAGALASATDPAWDDDGLADDVATISYDQALRNHVRSQSRPLAPSQGPHAPATEGTAAPSIHDDCDHSELPDTRPLKTASITIRLSEPDCRQVRDRAAEAGLTVSAYLRSCALEVESLRAQVKATLAQLQNAPEAPIQQSRRPPGTRHLRSILAALLEWFRQFGRRRRPAIRLNPSNPFAPVRY